MAPPRTEQRLLSTIPIRIVATTGLLIWLSFAMACGGLVACYGHPNDTEPDDPDASPPHWSAGNHSLDLIVDELDRHAIVRVPPGEPPETGWPVVLIFHGGGGQAAHWLERTSWGQTADAGGFLAIFPDGTREDPDAPTAFTSNQQTWNDGSSRAVLGAVLREVDDVTFVATLLDELERQFPVDTRRVYATGFSNGASLSFRLGRELPHRIAAIAPVAGIDWLHAGDPPQPAPPVLYITGTADPLNPIAGGEIYIGTQLYGVKPPTEEMIAAWRVFHACTTTPRIVHDNDGDIGRAWDGPAGANRVVVYLLEGHGHHWPGGTTVLPQWLAGPDVSNLDATTIIWSFFSNHALTHPPEALAIGR